MSEVPVTKEVANKLSLWHGSPQLSRDDVDKHGIDHVVDEGHGGKSGSIELSEVVDENSRQDQSQGMRISPRKARLNERIQLFVLCWTMFLTGYNDGTTGPMLPRIQEVYHVGYAVVSLIFISNTVGFLCGAVANMWLSGRWGFGKTIALGSACQTIAYAIDAAAPPFPVFVLAYCLNGFGFALDNSQCTGYVAAIRSNSATKMGIVLATYGLGAFVSPLAGTHFAQTERWSFHFLVSLGIALSNTVLLLAVFRGRTQEECLADIGQAPEESATFATNCFRRVMGMRSVHFLAVFVLVYVGVEVTVGGWIVTFIIEKRGGGPSSGYISSGFFGGLALGRVALLWLNKLIGERRALFLYGGLALALEVVIWQVPSLIGNAVAVSFVGLLLGPMYPIAMNQSGRVIPRWILTPAIGWISGFGQAGSAVLPFITGAIANKVGIGALQPLLVSMMAVLIGCWALVPTAPRRVE